MRKVIGPLSAWLTALGALLLLVSLFLTWSHQISPAEHRLFHGAVLYGVPADPDAWQVYAITSEVLAALAVGVGAAGLWGQRRARALTLAAVAAGLAFVLHAAGNAPTNGLLLTAGTAHSTRYVTDSATAGTGETLATVALILSAIGLLVGLVRVS